MVRIGKEVTAIERQQLKLDPRQAWISDAEFMARRNKTASKAYQFTFTNNPIQGRAKDLFNNK